MLLVAFSARLVSHVAVLSIISAVPKVSKLRSNDSIRPRPTSKACDIHANGSKELKIQAVFYFVE